MAEVATHIQSARPATRPEIDGYRPDIDGLRGVAVLLVVLWHARVPGLPGGYAGVDIFFVISGYVITGSLLRDGGAGVSILAFYARRLRRIAPAFLVMLSAVLAASFLFELPAELMRTARMGLGALALSANLVVWRYLGPDFKNEPLGHVWSLSIEEQFYLVYPALLGLLLARAPRAARPVLAVLAAASLALFLLLFRRAPEAAFELGPTRAWELLIGCVCALQPGAARLPRVAGEALTLAGVALVAAAALGVARSEPATILSSSLGAGLLVLCGRPRPLVSRLLAAPPLRFVGLVSYSLYLWHWPLLALARSLRPTGIGAIETALLLAAAAALGVASWRFVEQPLRRPWADTSARRRFFLICGALVVFCLGASLLALVGGGWPQRFPPRVAAIAAYEDFTRTPAWRAQARAECFADGRALAERDADACFTAVGRRNALLWGDSHAAELAGPLAHVSAQLGAHLMQATKSDCAPAWDDMSVAPECLRFDGWVRRRLQTQHADVVVLAALRLTPGVLGVVDALTRGGATVIVVGPTPQYRVYVAPILARTWPATPDLAPWALRQPFIADRVLKAAIAARPGARYVSALELFCPAGRCAAFTPSGAPLIWDKHHLSPEAAQLLVARIAGPLAASFSAPPTPAVGAAQGRSP